MFFWHFTTITNLSGSDLSQFPLLHIPSSRQVTYPDVPSEPSPLGPSTYLRVCLDVERRGPPSTPTVVPTPWRRVQDVETRSYDRTPFVACMSDVLRPNPLVPLGRLAIYTSQQKKGRWISKRTVVVGSMNHRDLVESVSPNCQIFFVEY